MSTLTPKSDYVAEGLNYLRQGLKGRPKIAATLQAFLGHCQDIENALQGLQNGLFIQNATGATLDNIASMVGAARNGLDDDSLRLFVYAQIAANNGDATLQATVELVSKLFNTPSVFARHPLVLSGPNGLSGAFVEFAVGSPKLPARLWPIAQGLLAKNVGGGVRFEPMVNYDAGLAFAFASNTAADTTGGGFGDINDPDLGAPLASLLNA